MRKLRFAHYFKKINFRRKFYIITEIKCSRERQETIYPAYLQYRDEGYIYFPCPELLPFLKAIDSQVNKIVNHKKFTECGLNLLSNLVEKVEGDDALPSLFMDAVTI